MYRTPISTFKPQGGSVCGWSESTRTSRFMREPETARTWPRLRKQSRSCKRWPEEKRCQERMALTLFATILDFKLSGSGARRVEKFVRLGPTLDPAWLDAVGTS